MNRNPETGGSGAPEVGGAKKNEWEVQMEGLSLGPDGVVNNTLNEKGLKGSKLAEIADGVKEDTAGASREKREDVKEEKAAQRERWRALLSEAKAKKAAEQNEAKGNKILNELNVITDIPEGEEKSKLQKVIEDRSMASSAIESVEKVLQSKKENLAEKNKKLDEEEYGKKQRGRIVERVKTWFAMKHNAISSSFEKRKLKKLADKVYVPTYEELKNNLDKTPAQVIREGQAELDKKKDAQKEKIEKKAERGADLLKKYKEIIDASHKAKTEHKSNIAERDAAAKQVKWAEGELKRITFIKNTAERQFNKLNNKVLELNNEYIAAEQAKEKAQEELEKLQEEVDKANSRVNKAEAMLAIRKELGSRDVKAVRTEIEAKMNEKLAARKSTEKQLKVLLGLGEDDAIPDDKREALRGLIESVMGDEYKNLQKQLEIVKMYEAGKVEQAEKVASDPKVKKGLGSLLSAFFKKQKPAPAGSDEEAA